MSILRIENNSRLSAILVVSLGLVAVSTGGILVRFSEEAPALAIAAYRMVFATFLLTPFYLSVRRHASRGGSWTWKHGLSGLALALHFAFWVSSLQFTSVAVSVLLVNTSPAFVAVGSRFLLGERLTWKGVGGLVAVLGGSLLLGLSDLREIGDWRGAGLALAGAVALGAYLMVGRRIRQDSNLIEYVYPTYAVAALALVGATLVSGRRFTGFGIETYFFLLLLGLIPQVIGHTSYNWALRLLPATSVSTLIVGEPILAGVLAWWLLGEGLYPALAPGAVLVLGGIILVNLGGIRPAPSPDRSATEARLDG